MHLRLKYASTCILELTFYVDLHSNALASKTVELLHPSRLLICIIYLVVAVFVDYMIV